MGLIDASNIAKSGYKKNEKEGKATAKWGQCQQNVPQHNVKTLHRSCEWAVFRVGRLEGLFVQQQISFCVVSVLWLYILASGAFVDQNCLSVLFFQA